MKKGFTLIELMIVIAIVGILTAIAIPNFRSMKDKGAIASANGTLKNVLKAIEAYRALGNGYIPADYSELVDKVGPDGLQLFRFNQLEGAFKKFAYGTTSGRYTLAGLAMDSDETAVWINDKSKGGTVPHSKDKPPDETYLNTWDVEF